MSLRAMLWALHDAPVADPTAALVLVGLGDHAADDGTGARPSRRKLARYARCSVDTVDRRLKALLEAGAIVLGDQRAVEHLPADRRPVVYDLVMTAAEPVDNHPGTGPQAAAPSGDGAAPVRQRGRTGAASGAAAVRHRTVLEQSRTTARERAGNPRSPSPSPRPATTSRRLLDATTGDELVTCGYCHRQHPELDPCSVYAAPPPPSLRAIAEQARAGAR